MLNKTPENNANDNDTSLNPHDEASGRLSDINTRTHTITFFEDKFAKTARVNDLTLPQLADGIRQWEGSGKFKLPWLKWAIFGNRITPAGCLRSNDNVDEITGIEGEHDAGDMSFDEAVAAMRKADIRVVVYTSPSYAPKVKERWRILVPLSKNHPPEMREELVARLNGLVGGKLTGESFTLSQAYLFGHVTGHEYRVEVIDGDLLDQRDDLVARAIYKSGRADGSSGARRPDPREPEQFTRAEVEAALAVIPADCSYGDWLAVAGGLYRAFGDNGFELFDRWSATAGEKKAKDGSPMYTAAKSRERWLGARSLVQYTARTIFWLADRADPGWRDRYDVDLAVLGAWSWAQKAGAASNGAGTGTGTGATGTGPAQPGTGAPGITATLYEWIDPAEIPLRQWLYGRLLIRQFVTATVAPGGLGKSTLVTAETLAQVSGKSLLEIAPECRLRVWLWNLEDPKIEITRKIQAVAKHYGLKREDLGLGERLFVDSGRDQPLVTAIMTRTGAVIVRPMVDALVAEIVRRKIDVIVIDPFVSSHEVPENDNNAQDMVVKEWGRVADKGNCAVHLVDHTRKMGGAESEVTVESSRGAKAKTDAARVVRVVNRMSKDEGEKAGVENHRLYFRTYNDKANMQPPADQSDWFKLESVSLGNGKLQGWGGDEVGVATRWQWPNPLAGVTGVDFEKVAAVIKREKWRQNAQAKAWVGRAVAEALDLDLDEKNVKTKVSGMLKSWIAAGLLVVVDAPDEHRELKKFVEVQEKA